MNTAEYNIMLVNSGLVCLLVVSLIITALVSWKLGGDKFIMTQIRGYWSHKGNLVSTVVTMMIVHFLVLPIVSITLVGLVGVTLVVTHHVATSRTCKV